MLKSLALVVCAAATAAASYTKNLNYRSPSEHHPFMGIALHKVVRRNNPETRYINASALSFTHGVASGDPYANSVILWTRCATMVDDDKSNGEANPGRNGAVAYVDSVTVSGTAPLYNHETESYVRISTAPVCVNYKVATDEALCDVVTSGQAYTTSDIDYTVKVRLRLPDAATRSEPSRMLTIRRSRPWTWTLTHGTTISSPCATPTTRAR